MATPPAERRPDCEPRSRAWLSATLVCCAVALAGCGRQDVADPSAVAPREGQTGWGMPGEPAAARRTIRITVSDGQGCSPAIVEVGHDETVRFEFRNTGSTEQEIVMGTGQASPWRAQLAPGAAGALVWNFSRAGEFGFACIAAGQGGPGMAGRIRVVEPASHKH